MTDLNLSLCLIWITGSQRYDNTAVIGIHAADAGRIHDHNILIGSPFLHQGTHIFRPLRTVTMGDHQRTLLRMRHISHDIVRQLGKCLIDTDRLSDGSSGGLYV